MPTEAPITIPLNQYQIAQLNAFDAAIKQIEAQKQAAIRIVVSGVVDPNAVGDYQMSFAPQAIVLTPPVKPDIAPKEASA